jgi:hypothetical protein
MKNKIWVNTNALELNTLFEILLFAGAEKRSDETIENIFLDKMSNANMSVNRFDLIMRHLRELG